MSKDKEYVDRVIAKKNEREFRKAILTLLVEIRDLLKKLVENKE